MKKSILINFSKTVEEKISRELKTAVRVAIDTTLRHEKFPFDARVSVTFCDNSYIKELNARHRGIDKPTDVLSFPMYDNGNFDISECISGAWLGDIVISLERAREQAREFCNTDIRETVFLTVHSTLHLLGYDHERSEADDELQCEKQREIMKKIEEKVNLYD